MYSDGKAFYVHSIIIQQTCEYFLTQNEMAFIYSLEWGWDIIEIELDDYR